MDEDYCIEYPFDAGLMELEDKMDNKLEEIRERDAKCNLEKDSSNVFWIYAEVNTEAKRHYTACSDRRWLLGEVERLRARVSELEGYVTDQEYFLDTPEEEE